MPSAELVAAREARIAGRRRDNPKWKNPPVRIEAAECIVCDSCLRECPPQFGAIFNDGIDVKVLPELCSGCNRCIRVCPIDCIYPDPDFEASAESLWRHAGSAGDPYVNVRAFGHELANWGRR